MVIKIPQLRNYQEKVVNETLVALKNYQRVLIVAGTGAGKTVISSSLIHSSIEKGKKVLFLVHRDILIEQTQAELNKYGLVAGVIAGNTSPQYHRSIQIASVQTLARRNLDFSFDEAYADEAHITSFSSPVLQLFPKLTDAKTTTTPKLIGLTATPFRLSPQEAMGDIFQEVVCAPVPNDLINDNYLIKPVYYSISSIDTSKIKTTPGKDFTKKQLNVICNVPEVISSAVEHWLRLAAGRPTIAFTAGVEHARSLAEAFQSTGITAIAIDGSMSREHRKVYYDRLARGELLVLCSCEALSEGFNVPCISCILLCRPTKSRAKFLQQIGRGLRLSEGKSDCLILDQANLVLQFGYIEDLNAGDFSLAASEEKTRKHTPPLKVCPNCQKLLYSFQRSCPCSYQFPVGQIKKMASGELTRNLHPQDLEAFTFIREELVKAYALGLHPDTAVHSYRERYGSRQLPQDWLRGAIFGEEPSPEQRSALREYLSRVAQSRRIPKYWIDEQMKRLL